MLPGRAAQQTPSYATLSPALLPLQDTHDGRCHHGGAAARPSPPQGAEPWLCRVCRRGQEVACLKSWGPPRPSMQSLSHNSNPFLKGTLTLSKLSNTIGEERFPQEERKVGTDQADGSAASLLPSLPLCRHCTGATLAKAPGVSHGLGGLGTELVTRGTP